LLSSGDQHNVFRQTSVTVQAPAVQMFSKLKKLAHHYVLKHAWSTVKCSLYEGITRGCTRWGTRPGPRSHLDYSGPMFSQPCLYTQGYL